MLTTMDERRLSLLLFFSLSIPLLARFCLCFLSFVLFNDHTKAWENSCFLAPSLSLSLHTNITSFLEKEEKWENK
jgi:hypothetical protein